MNRKITLPIPEVPQEVLDLLPDEALLLDLSHAQLWHDVCTELLESEFERRAHHSASTYNAGCHGPLCRKAHREHPRRRPVDVDLILREERYLDPILEYFHTVIKYRIRAQQQELIKELL